MRRGNWTPSLRASLSFSFSSSMLWAVIFVGLSLPVGSLAGLELQQHQESSRRWATRLELLSHQYNPALKSITPESTNIIALPTVRMQLRGGAEVDGQPGSNNFLDPESLEKFVWYISPNYRCHHFKSINACPFPLDSVGHFAAPNVLLCVVLKCGHKAESY